MSETTPDDVKAETLIADLQRLKGLACASCKRSLCGHELLFSFVMGFKGAPQCAPCLSNALAREPGEFRSHLAAYIGNRGCYQAAWRWTSSREGACPVASDGQMPSCPACGAEAEVGADAEWDAGEAGCGDLMLGLRMRIQSIQPGQVLRVVSTDPGAPEDIPAWCGLTGHTLVHAKKPVYFIRRKET